MSLIVPRVAIENGEIINGTAFFVTDTKPTTRIGGAALVAGDRWYKSDDGTEWFWNGTYWLSTQLIASSVSQGTESYNVSFATDGSDYNIFVEHLLWSGKVGATTDALNYKEIQLVTYNNNGINITTAVISSDSNFTPGTYFARKLQESRHIATTQTDESVVPTINVYYYKVIVTGSPGTAWSALQVFWRYAFK